MTSKQKALGAKEVAAEPAKAVDDVKKSLPFGN